MKITASLLATCVLTLAACGADQTPSEETASAQVDDQADRAEVVVIEITRSRFSAPELTVAIGTTVRFVNQDEFAHTVTSKEGSALAFDSGGLGQGDTFDMTFDEAGEFAYFCQIHPTMRGVVIVE